MEKKVLDHGFVRLIDHMPQTNLDAAIVQAARVSYGEGTKTARRDTGLIRYLMRHWHNTPFEMVEFKFHISKCLYTLHVNTCVIEWQVLMNTQSIFNCSRTIL